MAEFENIAGNRENELLPSQSARAADRDAARVSRITLLNSEEPNVARAHIEFSESVEIKYIRIYKGGALYKIRYAAIF